MIDQVRVTRDVNEATIEHAEASAPTVLLTIGPQIAAMTDADIVEMYNDCRFPPRTDPGFPLRTDPA
jgi:hypothetical protein